MCAATRSINGSSIRALFRINAGVSLQTTTGQSSSFLPATSQAETRQIAHMNSFSFNI